MSSPKGSWELTWIFIIRKQETLKKTSKKVKVVFETQGKAFDSDNREEAKQIVPQHCLSFNKKLFFFFFISFGTKSKKTCS